MNLGMKGRSQLPDGTLRPLCSEIEAGCKEDSVPAPEPVERMAD